MQSGTNARVQAPGCCQSPAKPNVLGVNARQETSKDAASLVSLVLAVLPRALLPPSSIDRRLDWLIYCIPPPTDLVIVHRHFLI
jgi:hypothetical protein